MGSTIGKFDFTIFEMKPEHELPFDPFVIIDLKSWGMGKGSSPTLSPNLMTKGEIDEYIKQMKADLDLVGARAKLALVAARKKTKNIVSDRNSN